MKQIDRNFEVSEDAYKAIFKNFPNPLYIWKMVGKNLILVAFNNAAFKITKGGIEKYRGIQASELYKQNPRILEDLNRCFNKKTSFYKKLPYTFKTTNETKILLVFFNYIPPDLVLIYTEDKTSEEESKKNFQAAYNRAEFYKDIFAHDINNILQNIRSASDLLEIYQNEEENPRNIQEMIDIIKSQVVRGANLVSNIRKLSLLDNIEIPLKKVSVKDILFKAVASIKDVYSEKQIEVNMKLPENDFKVFANQFLLDVFENILYNAIEFNHNDVVKIDIIVSKINIKEKSFIETQFIDNGIGIQDDRKERIFQRSFTQKEKGKGMGLGLSLVKKILEAYHATIKVENRVKEDYKKGSNFIISFPKKIYKS
jgi:signal transduction histidine kinase